MTNKQIIDGVDISGCPYAEPAYKTPKCKINRYIHCDGINCHYKRMIHTGIEKDIYKKECFVFSHNTYQNLIVIFVFPRHQCYCNLYMSS